jgi:hypothetical protein
MSEQPLAARRLPIPWSPSRLLRVAAACDYLEASALADGQPWPSLAQWVDYYTGVSDELFA